MSMNESQFGTMDEPGDGFFVDLTVYGDENIAGDVVIGGNLSVTGTSELILTETLMGDLIMGDATTKGGNIQVYRDASGNLGFDYQPGVSLALTDQLSMAVNYKIQFRDAAIYVQSADDGHLDLTADTSIDLNAAVDVTGSYLSVGTNPAASGTIRIPNASYIYGRNAANSADIQMWGISSGNLLYTGSETHIENYLYLGTNPAQSGQLRLPNKAWITGRNAANSADLQLITASSTDAVGLMGGYVIITSSSVWKTNNDRVLLKNNGYAADMDGTETSILWQQMYYNASTPAYVSAARITFGTEGDWTSDVATQDGYLKFQVVVNGTVTEMLRIDSTGMITSKVLGAGFATATHKLFTISGKDELDITSLTAATGGILSVFPNGAPAATAVEASIAIYGTDYEADSTNYSALYIEKWNAHADLGSNWVIRPAYGGSGTQLDLEIWQQRTGAGAAHQKLLSFKTVAGADCYTVLNKALLTDVATQIQFRDAAIHVESADDGHLDLTADTSIDLNAAISAGGILTMNGDYDIQFGNSASELLWYDGSSTYDVNLKRGGANLLQTDDTLYAALGLRTKEDSGDYNADWSGYTPPTGTSGLIIAAHNTNGSGSDRLYWYAGSAWHYVAAA